jgi:tRNA(fMet)-specific endonuclease VapC
MTGFMLDTNICIELIRGRGERVLDQLRTHPPGDVAISAITFAQLQFGVSKSARPQRNALLLIQFCAPLAIAPFDAKAAETYGAVRAGLERDGRPIGPLDTLIAAHALSLGHTVVTNNLREFRRVSGLKVENWLAR